MAQVVTRTGGRDYLVDDLGYVGDLSWSHGWPYGCLEAPFTVVLPRNQVPRALSAWAHVEIWDGPVRVWVGFLSEPKPSAEGDRWEIAALGWWKAMEHLLALNAGGTAPTAVPEEAVTAAITRAGLPIVYGGGLPSTSITSADETVGLNYIRPLLDTATSNDGLRWMVDADYVLTAQADPTVPNLHLASTVALRATADDEYVTDVYPRFVSSIDGTTGEPDGWGLGHVSSASSPAGRRERGMDVTDRGQMTEGDAETLAQGQLDLNSARMGYTEGLEVGYGELLRPGGTPARLGLVAGRDMFTAFTVADASGAVLPGLTQDVVIGRTTYRDGASTLGLTPVGLVPRTFVDTLAALKPREGFDGTAA